MINKDCEKDLYNHFNEMAKKQGMPTESIEQLYSIVIREFIIFLEQCDNSYNSIDEISQSDVKSFLRQLKIQYKRNTVASKFRALKRFCEYLYSIDITVNLYKNLDENDFLEDMQIVNCELAISKEDIEKIYMFIDNPNNEIKDRLIMGLLLYQGLSKGEICLLRKSSLDLFDNYIYTHTSKYEKGTGTKKVMVDKVNNLFKQFICKYNPQNKAPLLGYKSKTSSTFNDHLHVLTDKIINQKLSPTDLRVVLIAKLIEKSPSKTLLITFFLNETAKNTMDRVNEYSFFEADDLEDEIRKFVN